MRETPPYSFAEIRLLIVQYLDGLLEPDRMVALDELLTQHPEYQQEFLKMQAARGKVHEVLGQQAEAALASATETGSLWENIAGQLELDQKATPGNAFSAEWISAYVDGEISRQDAEREVFEGQLAGNDEANRLLGELTQVSESVKQFGYRLENACSVDVTQAVMAAYQAEVTGGNLKAVSGQPDEAETDEIQAFGMAWTEWELLSAFTDKALSPRETIQATQLIESSDAARGNLARLNRLSEHIQRVGQQAQGNAPDLWPAVHEALKALPDSEKIVPLARKNRLRWLRKAAVPLAASLLLGLLYLPNLSVTPSAKEAAPGPMAKTASATATPPAESRELASVPVSARRHAQTADMVPALNAADLEGSDVSMPAIAPAARAAAAPASKPLRLKPILEKNTVADSSHAGISPSVIPADDAVPRKSPSSEAYLFDSLNRQSAEEDISNILGK